MFSLIATDSLNHVLVSDAIVDALVDNKVATRDEDGDVEIIELRAASAYCKMIAFDLALDLPVQDVDQLMQDHAEAGGILHCAAERGAKVLALRAE
jgi:hypothetical protein